MKKQIYFKISRQSILLWLWIIPTLALAQQIDVRGTVKDKQGEPLIGVLVKVKGTPSATITDTNGVYALSNVPATGVLEVSLVGMQAQSFEVNHRNEINITLVADDKMLEEVVVVGYGTQRKVNLTGSLNTINLQEMTESRPITNISTGLAGLASGVYVNAASNRPADNNASILVRGQGTLNNSAPLIIVDGLETNINNVNPQDVENLTVLKDAASSSIYGSRAANGVILITTKKGKQGRLQLDYNGYISMQSAANTIEPVSNYTTYMRLMNEGFANSGQAPRFSEAIIKVWEDDAGKDPLKYPNTDWRKAVLRTAMAQTHALNLAGGSEFVQHFTSFRYMRNPGIIENSGIERYDLRSNVDVKLKKWLTLGTNLSAQTTSTEMGNDNLGTLFQFANASTPGIVMRAPDGRYGVVSNPDDDAQANNLLHLLNNTIGEDKWQRASAKLYAVFSPIKSLVINGSYTYETTNQKKWAKPNFNDRWNFITNTVAVPGAGKTWISNSGVTYDRQFMDIYATFDTNISKLNFKAMVGASQEEYDARKYSVTRQNLMDLSLSVIDAATGPSDAKGSWEEWAMRSFFGRLNFNWDEKYLLELNFRADGSSKFLKTDNRRWGRFPSFSAGWRIDQEQFMRSLLDKGLSNLKLRLSYGSLGNNAIGNYDVYSTYDIYKYVLNNTVQDGITQNAIANERLTWESTYMANVGVDVGLFNNRLSGTLDVFNKKTIGILVELPGPLVHGTANLPKQNAATVVNNGIELTLAWEDRINDFHYYVKGNVSHIKNKVTKYRGDIGSITGTNLLKEGLPIGTQILMEADRIIQTNEDLLLVEQIIQNAPLDEHGNKRNPFATYGKPELGDILYKDLDGNGVIDDNDRREFGNGTNPTWFYGLSLGADYKGIDFSILLQGVGDYKVHYLDEFFRPLVRHGYQINSEIAAGRWYAGRTTPAKYPRLMEFGSTKNTVASSLWLTDKAYLKIRNIQLGYTLPKQLSSYAQIEKVRFYISLENFFTFTSYPGIDPEVNNTNYPTMRQALFGLNITL